MDKARFLCDPFALLEAMLPPPWPHRLLRAAAIAVLIAFFVHRVAAYRTYSFKPLWVVETLMYVIFIVSYVVRADPVERSRGFKEVALPLAGAVLPFGLLAAPPSPLMAASVFGRTVLFSFMTATTAFTLWGLWSLRRAFSITVEARMLVSRGPYRWVRHPVYAGEILTAASVTAWRLTPANIVIFFLFAGVQLLRARWEETKLSAVLPDYTAYARRARWLW